MALLCALCVGGFDRLFHAAVLLKIEERGNRRVPMARAATADHTKRVINVTIQPCTGGCTPVFSFDCLPESRHVLLDFSKLSFVCGDVASISRILRPTACSFLHMYARQVRHRRPIRHGRLVSDKPCRQPYSPFGIVKAVL